MAVLIGMSGDVKGKNFAVEGDELTIGRSADNTVSINNATVSGHHCVIRRDGDRYVLTDLGSTNGTRVNSHEVKESALRPKDLVQVGSVEFLFNSEAATDTQDASSVFTSTEEMVADSSNARPESFNNISPFGARRRESQGAWATALWALGVITLLAVGALFYVLATA